MYNWIPYVYLVKNKTTKLSYIGVRYAKGCRPIDFWDTYFTSSKLVHSLIQTYGKTDFVFKILHKFPDNPEGAILKEAEYFKLLQKRNNYLNCCYSSGFLDPKISSKAGKVGGSIVKNKKIGIFRSEKERRHWASLGGKIGGKAQAERGLGFHLYKNNPELHRKNSSKGGLISGQFQNKMFQSEMGKRGGLKNKGFVWITDGERSFKYTVKQQEKLSIESFLKLNDQFRKGRIVHGKNKKDL